MGNNLKWGGSQFKTSVGLKPLYKLLGLCFIAILLFGGLSGVVAWGLINGLDFSSLGAWAASLDPEGRDIDAGIMGSIYIGVIFTYIAIGLTFIIYAVGTRNIAYCATKLLTQVEGEPEKEHRLHSDMSPLYYIWILVSNLIVTLASLGLMRAWAAVRTWRYKCVHTAFLANGSLDNLVAEQTQEGRATSAEFFDIEGIDLGL